MIILVDGRSGSGKTELARAMVAADPALQLVRLDDLYPGWDGLDAGSAAVPGILSSLRFQAWDWAADAPGVWHELEPGRPILVEGVGSISRASRPFADRAIWVDLDDETRKARALARDPYYAEYWERWAAHEEKFIARERPRELASERVMTELSP